MNRAMIGAAREALTSVEVVLLVVDAEGGDRARRRRGGPDDRRRRRRRRSRSSTRSTASSRNQAPRSHEDGGRSVGPRRSDPGLGDDRERMRPAHRSRPAPPARRGAALPRRFPHRSARAGPGGRVGAREDPPPHARGDPHAAAVVVERWVERADGLVEIEATIFVERDSQKGIVIGKGGVRARRRSGPRPAPISSGSSSAGFSSACAWRSGRTGGTTHAPWVNWASDSSPSSRSSLLSFALREAAT